MKACCYSHLCTVTNRLTPPINFQHYLKENMLLEDVECPKCNANLLRHSPNWNDIGGCRVCGTHFCFCDFSEPVDGGSEQHIIEEDSPRSPSPIIADGLEQPIGVYDSPCSPSPIIADDFCWVCNNTFCGHDGFLESIRFFAVASRTHNHRG
ncbi:uncharacterized protein LOC111692234 [Anoplophora glabripennis]|uniref:uncharacterized protein LOC111692234 n=1 Tax=Anoplophora glabripennis TaxID=217634 RepID=UPI000C76B05B|nr:uncharacterized protein LOC111692234 [Anoplophora glabripennis]